MRKLTLASCVGVLGILSTVANAAEKAAQVVEVGPAIFQPASPKAAPAPAPVLSAPALPDNARHALGPLSDAERTRLQSPDQRKGARAKAPAVRVGISRTFPAAVGFNGLTTQLAAGDSEAVAGGLLARDANGAWTWTASFSSDGAGAVRLYVRRASLPPGSQVFVFSADRQLGGPYAFDRGTRPEGFWTNTIFSDRVFLQVQFGAATAAAMAKAVLLVGSIVHLEHPDFAPSAAMRAASALNPKADDCFVDRSCVTTAEFSNIDLATRAVGQLTFMDGGGAFICTGGLLNTTTGSSVPYLLTANHCFSTQASATSLEAFWQYRTAFCGAGIPNENNFPRTLGSTLLATAAVPSSDFTFVQLSENPPDDSVLLGWTTANVTFADNLMLYRLSYANGDPMIFTREQVSAVPSPDVCSDAPQSNFIYTKDVQGASGGGSSGSPEYLEDLRVVGQEYGQCGENSDDCDVTNNSTIDGAFRVTFPSIRQWLEPGNPGPCVANATTLCLNAARFRVTVSYSTAQGSGAASGAGMAVPLTADSGYFWFFDASNIELIVKVLDACSISQHFWVFAGGLTNVGVTIIVEDTETGASQVYTNPVGTAFQPLQDTAAFTCP